MHLITTSELRSVDERIHTLADRRMVISLMNGAFDQDLNVLLCWFSCVGINSAPFKVSNVLIVRWENASAVCLRMQGRGLTQCEALIIPPGWLCPAQKTLMKEISHSQICEISNYRLRIVPHPLQLGHMRILCGEFTAGHEREAFQVGKRS